jgi:threonine/homoserine/homoserine lactone efflux protein
MRLMEYIVLGGGFAAAAAIQPGPLQAFLLSSVAQRGWKRTLPASFAPLISDGPIALLVLLFLNQVPTLTRIFLQAGGGILLLYLAWSSYRNWKRPLVTSNDKEGSIPQSLLQASLVNLLNPNPYLGWSLVLGPVAVNAWRVDPINAVALLSAFYGVMVLALAGTIIAFGTTRFLGERGRRGLILISAVILAFLGIYQLFAALTRLGAA